MLHCEAHEVQVTRFEGRFVHLPSGVPLSFQKGKKPPFKKGAPPHKEPAKESQEDPSIEAAETLPQEKSEHPPRKSKGKVKSEAPKNPSFDKAMAYLSRPVK